MILELALGTSNPNFLQLSCVPGVGPVFFSLKLLAIFFLCLTPRASADHTSYINFIMIPLLLALLALLAAVTQAQTACTAGKYGVLDTSTSGSTAAQDCLDHFTSSASSGVYTINPGFGGAFSVYCDFTTAGGPWTVFQKRTGAADFYYSWTAYEAGFGTLSSHHWLGLSKIRRLTTLGSSTQLRIDICQGQYSACNRYAQYSTFTLGTAADRYRLGVSGFSGTVGDGMWYHSGKQFSTYDSDNDLWPNNCAVVFRGAWWYGACHYSNLNGVWGSTNYADGPVWQQEGGYYNPLEFTQMALKSTRTVSPPTTTCTNCPVGSYQGSNTFTGASCTLCPAGKHQAAGAASSCTSCALGYVQPATGQQSCTACSTGQYQDSTGQQTCTACAIGKYGPTAGLSGCANCAPGQHQSSTFSIACDDCAKGQYTGVYQATLCTDCPTGKFMADIGASSCIECAKGKYQQTVGSNSCTKCAKGQFSSSTGQKTCTLCAVGQYQSQTGGKSCPGQCTCGYFCDAGSINGQSQVCGEKFWCPAGTTVKNPIGDKQGTPVGSNPARFCGTVDCPVGFACTDGEATSLLSWNSPSSCKTETSEIPYVVQIDEDKTYSTGFGALFKVISHENVDTKDYEVVFSVSRWPGSAPTDCSTSRSPTGLLSKPSNNWLTIATTTGLKPSAYSGAMGTNAGLDAEACTNDYAAEISATLKRKR